LSAAGGLRGGGDSGSDADVGRPAANDDEAGRDIGGHSGGGGGGDGRRRKGHGDGKGTGNGKGKGKGKGKGDGHRLRHRRDGNTDMRRAWIWGVALWSSLLGMVAYMTVCRGGGGGRRKQTRR
jgi:hypothetical protein